MKLFLSHRNFLEKPCQRSFDVLELRASEDVTPCGRTIEMENSDVMLSFAWAVMRPACFGSLFFFLTAVAHAQCDARLVYDEDLVGKAAWLAHNEPAHIPYTIGEYKGLSVPVLKQVGPRAWEPADGKTLLQGMKVLVTSIVVRWDRSNLARYMEVDTGHGERVVVSSLSIVGFDFTKCSAAQVLLGVDNPNLAYRSQWMWALPMRMKASARPTDFGGRWIDQKLIASLELVDCDEYGNNSLNPSTVRCSPVWKDGVDGYKDGLPLNLYFTDSDLEQVVGSVR